MSLTRFRMRYDLLEDRAFLNIDTDSSDGYALWLSRSTCLKLLLRAQEIRRLAPTKVFEMERAARHPARVLALAIDPRRNQVISRRTPIGSTPARVDSVGAFLLNERVSCSLSGNEAFELTFSITWEFFTHWMLMIENIDEEGDWGLADALTEHIDHQRLVEAKAHRYAAAMAPAHDSLHRGSVKQLHQHTAKHGRHRSESDCYFRNQHPPAVLI